MKNGGTDRSVMLSSWSFNPLDTETRQVETEMRMRNRKGDPELPPEKEPGDIYIFTGVLLGLIIGGIIGFLIAASGIIPASLFFPLTIGGAIAGGIIGATIGNTVKKRIRETGTKKSKENPFIND